MRISTRVGAHTRVSMSPAGWLIAGPLVLCWYLLLFELLLMWWLLRLIGQGVVLLVAGATAAWQRHTAARPRT